MGTHFSVPVRPKARKQHVCVACLAPIVAGEVHVMQSGHFEDRAFRNRFHVECWDVLNESGDFEFYPGELEPPARLTEQQPADLGARGGETK